MDDVVSFLSSLFSSSYPFVVGFLGISILVVLICFLLLPKTPPSKGKKQHAVISGGSSGIGLSMASECLKQQVDQVTLIARNVSKLNKAKQDLLSTYPSAKIHTISLDVTDPKNVATAMETLVKEKGPPSLVFNNAGTSIAREFIDLPMSEFDNMMKVNYLGSVYVTKALLPSMIAQGNASSGRSIVFVSSMAGQCGLFGYTAYSPTKAAMISLSQSLQWELRPHGISVTVAYPPDTQTPGYELEQVGKPMETQLMSETAGLFTADQVARSIVEAALSKNPPFSVYFGLEGWMLATMAAGMSPVSSLVDAMCQVFLMGLLRFVSLFYLKDFERIVQKCYNKKEKPKKE